MNREDFGKRMYENANGKLRKGQIQPAIDAFCDTVAEGLRNGERVRIVGFGEWYPKARAARVGRNMKTNATVPIPSRILPWFKPGKDLTDATDALESGKDNRDAEGTEVGTMWQTTTVHIENTSVQTNELGR